MSLVKENGPPLLPRLWAIAKGSAVVTGFAALLIQCGSISELNAKFSSLKERPIAVSIGRNSIAQVGEPISPEENATEFLKEVLPLLQSLTNKIPKELDPKCARDPNCTEAQDRGVSLQGVEVPTLVGVASTAVSPSYRKALMPTLLLNAERTIGRKVNWKSGEAIAYAIFEVNQTDENNVYEVKGGYYHYSPKGQPIAAYEHDIKVTLREVIPPKSKSSPTSVQEVVAIALSRGLLIEFIEVI